MSNFNAREDHKDVSVVLPEGSTMCFPFYIVTILKMLNDNGFEAFAVGGCVRDSLMGIIPHDYDICTDADTDDIKEVFKDFRLIETGIKHGTVTVMSEGFPVEITTYRIDGEYKDHRRPEKVIFTKSIEADLQRRDFTVNAMAVSLDGRFCSAGDGIGDLKKRLIRCVGVAENRFTEDALRILRGMRFAARFGFEIEEDTLNAMYSKRNLLAFISSERIFSELSGLLSVKDGKNAALVLSKCKDIIGVVIPEFKPSFECDQHSRHHQYTVWEHILRSLYCSDNDIVVRWTLFLHDICKPYCMIIGEDGRGHFPKHDYYGGKIAKDVLTRLKASSELIEKVSLLVRLHDIRLSPGKKSSAKLLELCGTELVFKLIHVMECDISAQSDFRKDEKLKNVMMLKFFVEQYISEGNCFSIKDLMVGGKDIISSGVKPGPEIKRILNCLLEAVIDGKVENEREELIALARRIV